MHSSYYSSPLVSNSMLSKLKADLSGSDAKDLTEAYRRGTLLDVLVTEPERFNAYELSIGEYKYTRAEVVEALAMKKAFTSHPVSGAFYRGSQFQIEKYDEGIEWRTEFGEFVVGCRIRVDGLFNSIPWDLKRTAATSQSVFLDTFFEYDYDRQAAFYLEVLGKDKMIFFGVNKKGSVFPVYIERGSPMHQDGYRKAADLVFKLVMLE